MKLASLPVGRDGQLVLVSRDLRRCLPVPQLAATLQAALDDWAELAPQLAALSERMNAGQLRGCQPFNARTCAAPLPRAYQWLDGSAYLHHVELVRKARGADMPPSYFYDPLLYQGGSDDLLGPCVPLRLLNPDWGLDFEGEVVAITDDVPLGCSAAAVGRHICLLTLGNDVSLRNLIPGELAKGFGFVISKPATSFAAVALTPDELGEHWRDGKLHLPLRITLNGRWFGDPDAGQDMTFSHGDLIAHLAQTRRLGAGSLIGSGTVSNSDRARGSACLQEQRMLELLTYGEARTPFLQAGDVVRIEMTLPDGSSLFGAIEQTVEEGGSC